MELVVLRKSKVKLLGAQQTIEDRDTKSSCQKLRESDIYIYHAPSSPILCTCLTSHPNHHCCQDISSSDTYISTTSNLPCKSFFSSFLASLPLPFLQSIPIQFFSPCFSPQPLAPRPVPNQQSSISALQFISIPKYTPGYLTNSISSILPSLTSLAQISSAISGRRHGETSAPS